MVTPKGDFMNINLNIKVKHKTVVINGKTINIPKMGLKHHVFITESKSLEEGMQKILKSVNPNLSVAERDLVTLHILEYNGKIKNKILIDGIEYSIDDVEICQQLKFEYGGVEYKFKSPNFNKVKSSVVSDVLTECCVSAKRDGVEIDIPDFNDLPAFVYKWMDKICDTIQLKTHKGTIKTLYNLTEVFDG